MFRPAHFQRLFSIGVDGRVVGIDHSWWISARKRRIVC
jgi:hypothetical protein